ncbi:CAP domain-containing protein [Pontibacillus litoralis]|uniref:SCP domain-containing protein n=1 Tax=Pontibacillus litoralis JSM 072002 TaxID=1385512 RepID=A0A0A5HN28_9BACI|nr:CAP domain-containing protein [Pontibacillus litoralis]KGX84992.1 hypothetical protein N784_11495 [Pontibacillus litoralis JSM 072002]
MPKWLSIMCSSILAISLLVGCATEEEARTDINEIDTERLSTEYNQNELRQETPPPVNRFDVQGEVRKFTVPGGEMERYDINPEQFDLYPNRDTKQRMDKQPQYDQREVPGSQESNQKQEDTEEADTFVKQVVDLTNKERKKQGLPKLQSFDDLAFVAKKKSEDMAENEYFAHNSPTYGTPFEMMKNFGIDYKSAAENIAAGQQSPDEVVQNWMDSAGHRKNILNKNVTHIGVGVERGGKMGIYWTQMFIQK